MENTQLLLGWVNHLIVNHLGQISLPFLWGKVARVGLGHL